MINEPKQVIRKSITFTGRTLDEAKTELRDWLNTYGHKYRVTKEHNPKLLPIGQLPIRRAFTTPSKYSILVDYERIPKGTGS